MNSKLENKIEKLEPKLLGIFCLLCAERTQLIYQTFTNKFSDIQFDFQHSLDVSFDLVIRPKKAVLETLKKHVESYIHDSDDFISEIADQAQCSIICLFCALEYLSSMNTDCAIEAVQKLEEAIDIYDQEGGDGSHHEKLENEWKQELVNILVTQGLVNTKELLGIRERNVEYMLPPISKN